jgi:hypothetical protein
MNPLEHREIFFRRLILISTQKCFRDRTGITKGADRAGRDRALGCRRLLGGGLFS